jgi:hypothetical protein
LSARLKKKDELKSKAVDLLASSYRSIQARKKGDINKIKVT